MDVGFLILLIVLVTAVLVCARGAIRQDDPPGWRLAAGISFGLLIVLTFALVQMQMHKAGALEDSRQIIEPKRGPK